MSPDNSILDNPNAETSAPGKNSLPGRLERIFKIRLPVIVRIAERRMTIENILKLTPGSIIQFDKDAYQHIDLMVNNSIIGLGLPIKVGENFGLKIVQIGDITQTIKSLGG